MKRVAIIVLLLVTLVSVGAFAAKGSGWAIGGEGSLYMGSIGGGIPGGGGALTLHTPFLPIMFGISVDSSLAFGLTGDYWLFHQDLASIFDWYAGVGGYLSASSSYFGLGLRIPIGLQAWILGTDFLELFLEVAPALGVKFTGDLFYWHVQGAFGFRFWL